jgi:hypothetical protein
MEERKRCFCLVLSRTPREVNNIIHVCIIVYIYISLTLYPRRGSTCGWLDIIPRCLQTYQNIIAMLYYRWGARWPRGQCVRRTIAEAKQCWSVIGCLTKNLLSWAPPCFGRNVKPLVPAAFAVVSTPFSLCVIHKEGLGPSSGDISRLMMMMIIFA